jgi:hypothetical protein
MFTRNALIYLLEIAGTISSDEQIQVANELQSMVEEEKNKTIRVIDVSNVVEKITNGRIK